MGALNTNPTLEPNLTKPGPRAPTSLFPIKLLQAAQAPRCCVQEHEVHYPTTVRGSQSTKLRVILDIQAKNLVDMRPQNGGRVVSRSWHCLTISDKALTVLSLLSLDGFWKVGPRLSSVGIRFEDFRDCRVLFRVCPHLGTLSATSQAQPHLESEAQEPLNLATSLLLQGAGFRACDRKREGVGPGPG